MIALTKETQVVKIEHPRRVKLTEEEILKRMETFSDRKEEIIAAIRNSIG